MRTLMTGGLRGAGLHLGAGSRWSSAISAQRTLKGVSLGSSRPWSILRQAFGSKSLRRSWRIHASGSSISSLVSGRWALIHEHQLTDNVVVCQIPEKEHVEGTTRGTPRTGYFSPKKLRRWCGRNRRGCRGRVETGRHGLISQGVGGYGFVLILVVSQISSSARGSYRWFAA